MINTWHRLPDGFSVRFELTKLDENGDPHVFVVWDPRVPSPVPRRIRRALKIVTGKLCDDLGASHMAVNPIAAPAMASVLFTDDDAETMQ